MFDTYFLILSLFFFSYQPTTEDARVFADVTLAFPSGVEKKFAHAFRWFNHINHFSVEERSAWPAEPIQVEVEAPKPAEPVKETKEEAKEEDIDFDEDDLFGGVSEEELAAQKKRNEEIKSAKKKEEIIQKSNIILDVKVRPYFYLNFYTPPFLMNDFFFHDFSSPSLISHGTIPLVTFPLVCLIYT